MTTKYWNVLDEYDQPIKPRTYSTGTTQEDVVKQVIKRFIELDTKQKQEQTKDLDLEIPNPKKSKICILQGFPGTGKSLIALNVAKMFGKSLFVVPTKNLQHQYEKDYSSYNSKKLIKSDGSPMTIRVLKGRDNFKCIYGNNEFSIGNNSAADDINPCTMPTQASRISVAKECPYWSPLFHMNTNIDKLDNITYSNYYDSISGPYFQHERDNQCGYYKQFTDFINSDIGILNMAMFEMEMNIGRLPQRKLLVIDEFDYFLDSVRSEVVFTSNKIKNAIDGKFTKDINPKTLEKLKEAANQFMNLIELEEAEQIKPLKDNEDFIRFLDVMSLDEMRNIKGFKKDYYKIGSLLYLSDYVYYYIEKNDKGFKITFFVLNLKEAVTKIFSNFEYILGMSATLQDKRVLNDIYGLTPDTYGGNFIVSEKSFLGTLKQSEELKESDLLIYNNQTLKSNRKKFHQTLSKCLDISKDGQTLMHITTYSDLPSKIYNEHSFDLPYSEDIKELIQADKNGQMLKDFKEKKIQTLFSTKDFRGTDLPNDECRYIIFPKVPYLYMKEPFLIALEKYSNALFWMYYNDQMEREFLQGICRGLRNQDDYVTVLSPDLRVHKMVKKYIDKKGEKE